MLQHEFAELMGIDKNLITEEEYTTANAVYMMKETDAACYDKQHFVRRWKELQKDALFMAVVKNALAAGTRVYQQDLELQRLHERIAQLEKQVAQKDAEIEEMTAQMADSAEVLADEATADDQSVERTNDEPQKVYAINREWQKSENSTFTEEVARIYDLHHAQIMLKALCNEPGYKTDVNFEHLDAIWAVSATWTGGGEAHRYYISEEYINADGTINEWM